MKRFLIYFFLLVAFASHAQNWNAFNKDYRYNYVYNHNQLITNVLFADSIKQSGTDTVYYMNRIGVECQGTCPTITTAITSTATVIVPNMPQFLQRTIIKKADGTVLLQDTANWLIKPKCILNESWTFDAINSKTAQCVSISTVAIFSTIDSLKTIIVDGTDSLLLCKKFGIIQYPNVYGKNKYYRLVGIEKASSYDLNSIFGIKVPNAWDFYNFDVGDRFCNGVSTFFVGGSSNSHWSESMENISVISKTVNPGIGINYTLAKKKDIHYWGYGPAPNGSYNTYTFTATQSQLIIRCDTIILENTMYPGQIIRYCPQCTSPPLWFNNIVKFGEDNFSRFYKFAGPSCKTFSNLTLPNTLGSFSSYDWSDVLNNNNKSFTYMYGVGLGKINSVFDWSSGMYNKECLTCAFKNGSLYFGDETDVGMTESNFVKSNINVYPNPTSENLTIDLNDILANEIRLNNLLGQTVRSGSDIKNGKTVLNLKEELLGIYFLQIYNEGKLIDVRKVIKN